jgi:hypothetical protein
MNNNLADTSKLAETFFTTSKNVSLIALNDKPFYHISDCLRTLISEIIDRHGNASQNDKGGRHE